MMLLKVVALATALIAVVAADDADLQDTADIKIEAFDADATPEEMPENGRFFIDDMEFYPLRSGVLRTKIWPNGVIPYTIRGFSSTLESKIITAMREIEHDVNGPSGSCIKFVHRTNQANYIDINRGTGCHSVIGYTHRGAQDVSLGSGCELKGIMMHELMHTIGYWHEQNRPDRGTYVNINLNNVESGHTKNFKLLSSSSVSTYGTPYDFGSIMHYGAYSFAIDKTVPVLTPKPGKASSAEMGQRIKLSSWDVRKIQRLYRCTEDISHITNPLTSGNSLVNCNFASNYCGMSVTSTNPVSWTRTSASTSHGPKHGHSTGTDNYAVTRGHQGVAKFTTKSFNKGQVCVDMYLYQTGPSSHVEIYAEGSRIHKQLMKNYRGYYYNRWSHRRLTLNIPAGNDFKLIFEAHVVSEPIAIDDLHIYHGSCG